MAIITNLFPPPGEPIGASDPVSFDVIDPEVSELRIFVWAVFAGSASYELVHDGENFTPTYSFSTIEATPGGRTFTIQRVAGWPESPDLRVDTCACPPTISAGDVPPSRTITAGAGLAGGGDLSADRTIDIANGDGSITVNANDIQVGILQTDAQHGDLGGDTLHALAVAGGDAGFMSGTQAQDLATLVAAGPGVTDHGALSGLTDDDHTQYQLRSEQGSANGYPTLNASGHVTEPVTVLQETGGPTGLTIAAIPDGYLMQRSGTTVIGLDPTSLGGGSSDHGALTGLTDDDHTQYLLADGSRAGGTSSAQSFGNGVDVTGNVAASGHLLGGDGTPVTAFGGSVGALDWYSHVSAGGADEVAGFAASISDGARNPRMRIFVQDDSSGSTGRLFGLQGTASSDVPAFVVQLGNDEAFRLTPTSLEATFQGNVVIGDGTTASDRYTVVDVPSAQNGDVRWNVAGNLAFMWRKEAMTNNLELWRRDETDGSAVDIPISIPAGSVGGDIDFAVGLDVTGSVAATAFVSSGSFLEAGTFLTVTNYTEYLADSEPADPSSNNSRVWSDSSTGGRLHTKSDDGIARILGQWSHVSWGFDDFELVGTASRFTPTAMPDAANITVADNDGVRMIDQMPLDYTDGEDVVIDVLISTDNGDFGFTASMTITFDRLVRGTSTSDTRSQDTEVAASQVIPGSSDEVLYVVSTTIANANMDGVRPGDFFSLEILNDGASGTIYVHKVTMRGAAP